MLLNTPTPPKELIANLNTIFKTIEDPYLSLAELIVEIVELPGFTLAKVAKEIGLKLESFVPFFKNLVKDENVVAQALLLLMHRRLRPECYRGQFHL